MFKQIFGIAALALSFTAAAQQPPTVVDLPTRPGVTQRMRVTTPSEPKATVILLAGGHGGLQIFQNGSFKWGGRQFPRTVAATVCRQGVDGGGGGRALGSAARTVS